MSRLVEVAQPDVAVVTNVGPTHLEFFGSVEKVAAEKGILARAADLAVLNADDPFVAKMRDAADRKTILFGLCDSSKQRGDGHVMADEAVQDKDGRWEFTLATDAGKIRIHLSCPGKHNVYNALAAASIGILFHVELNAIKKALESYTGMSRRMQKMVVDGITIIDDTYNCNPVSLRAAVDYLSDAVCDGKKVLVVGDMLEQGEQADKLHREAGQFIAGRRINELVTVGDKAARIAEAALDAGFPGENVFVYRTNPEATDHLRASLGEDDIALIKGSRGVKMEEIVEALRKGSVASCKGSGISTDSQRLVIGN